MKYTRFLNVFRIHKAIKGEKPIVSDGISAAGIAVLPTAVYNDGLYAIIARKEATALTQLVETVFPTAPGKLAAFAVDWMGRVFCADGYNLDSQGAPTISFFDLAEPTSFATDVDFETFHNVTAVDDMADVFNLEQFSRWTAENKPPADGKSCIGYKVPLFLGGEDDQENMERTDRLVYLEMLTALWETAKNLPEGTSIEGVDLE
jgi:hypothetical protein